MAHSKKLRVLDLFSGIGGFSLGLERTGGFETVAFCEIEKFPQKVLAKHWPNVPIYEDVRNVTAEQLRADGISVDIVTGGFPCQDISVAGKQKGITAERSGLWSELARIIDEVRPRYAIVENVTALISGERGRWFGRVLGDLAEIGYDAEWHCIPASELGAHHHRDRVWIIAYPRLPESQGRNAAQTDNDRCGEAGIQQGSEPASPCSDVPDPNGTNGGNQRQEMGQKDELMGGREAITDNNGSQGAAPDTMQSRLQRREKYGIFGEGGERWHELTTGRFCGFQDISEIEPTICRGADGIPNYAHRLKGLGNAVVPQIPELIGRAILEAEAA